MLITIEQEERLRELANTLREYASLVGPMHAFWDTIFDIEAFLEGRRPILRKSAAGWILHAESLLKEVTA